MRNLKKYYRINFVHSEIFEQTCLPADKLDISLVHSFMKKFFTILLMFSILFPAISSAQESFLLAQTDAELKSDSFGIVTAGNQAGITKVAASNKIAYEVIADIIGIALTFIGIIFFALMLYAGANWMMAMGASEKVDTAKQTLEAAIIGLVIVIAAYAITSFVFSNIIGVTVGT